MQETLEKKALQYLEQDALSHIDMIEVIRRGFSTIYYAGEDGVAMKENKNGTGYLCAANQEAGERLLPYFPERSSLVLHEEFMLEPAKRQLHLTESQKCYQMIYQKETSAFTPEMAEKAGIEIRQLSMEWADTVNEIYHIQDDVEYIGRLLSEGVLYGAFDGEKLAGFIGIHLEGCMGLLEVLPEFRRRGIGEVLECFMIDYNLKKGYRPFCQVFTDNEASLRLQQKLGLTKADGCFWWTF